MTSTDKVAEEFGRALTGAWIETGEKHGAS